MAGHDGSINDLAYAGGDGRTIVTAGEDTTVRVWDTSRSETIGILFKHSQAVRSLAFSGGVSDDRRLLASGGDDRVVRIWDLATCEEVLTFSRHGAPVTSVIFRPGTRHVLSCDRDGTALFWDATSGAPLLGPDFPAALAAEFSPDGVHLALACKSGEVRVIDLDGEEKGSKLTIPGVTRPVFAPDGSYLAVVGRDGRPAVWDLKAGKLRCELNLDKAKAPVQLVIAPNGDRIWVATQDEGDFLLAFDSQTGAMLDQFGRDGPVDHMTLTPSGSRILTSGPDGQIRLWFVETGDTILTLRPHGVPVTCVRFSPSGEMLACADRRGLIRLWIAPDASHLVQENDGPKESPPR
jgi:WD40 repeat protein